MSLHALLSNYMFIHCRPRWFMASKNVRKITSDHMSVFDSINCFSILYYKKNHIWNKFCPCEVRLVRVQLPVAKAFRVRVHRNRNVLVERTAVGIELAPFCGTIIQSFWIEVSFCWLVSFWVLKLVRICHFLFWIWILWPNCLFLYMFQAQIPEAMTREDCCHL